MGKMGAVRVTGQHIISSPGHTPLKSPSSDFKISSVQKNREA